MITKDQRFFLKTKSGYVDPSPWKVIRIDDYGIELKNAKGKIRMLTRKELKQQTA